VANLWHEYDVRLDFTTELCGSTPGNLDLIEPWLKSRAPKVIPPGGKTITEITEEVFSTLAEPEEETKPGQLVFQRKDGKLVLRSAAFRAHIKDCARIISSLYVGKIEGEKSFSVRVMNGVYHDEKAPFTPILKEDSTPFTEPTGSYEKPVHAIGPRGVHINALKNIEYCDGAHVVFRLKVLKARNPKANPVVSKEDLETVFEYGAVYGYGGERSDGRGRYFFTVTEVNHE